MNRKFLFILLASLFSVTSCDFDFLEKFKPDNNTEQNQNTDDQHNDDENENEEEKEEKVTLVSITVSEDNRTFYAGDDFVKETVTAHFSDNSTKEVAATFSEPNMNSVGSQTINVSYKENETTVSTSYTITVVEKITYAEWPTKQIQDEVIVVSGSEVVIPAYDKASKIEINTDDEVDYGYFSIYCYTTDKKSENEYKEILLGAGWEVEEQKDEQGYISAYDSNYEVWINFGYFEEFADLEICVTFCYKTKWPTEYIAQNLQEIAPNTTTEIPEFEAYTVYATYYPEYGAIAINGYGFSDSIEEDYKQTLISLSWDVFYNETSAVTSPEDVRSEAQDIVLHFYVDDEKGDFNVDIFKYTPPVKGWPYEEIATLVEEMGATGEVPPFTGENTGFMVETDWFPPAIFIYCDTNKQQINALAYNKSLLDSGFVYVMDMYGDPVYAKPGTTLGLRALVMMGVLEIELFKLDEPAK